MNFRNTIIVLFQIGFIILFDPEVFGQVKYNNLEEIKNKDFIFKVLGYREGPASKIVHIKWITYDYIIVGQNNFNYDEKNEIKIYQDEGIMSIKYSDFIISTSEQTNDGRTISWLLANGTIDNKEEVEISLMKISGSDEVHLFLVNSETNFTKAYAITINY